MASHSRLDVLNTMVETGVVPLFYHSDVEIAKKLIDACAAGGARVIEFTNRGDFAIHVFSELAQHYAKTNPEVILGVGSIVDAPTAALFIANGANFVVGPTLNPEVAVLCNRRKIAYSPGCGTLSEISEAESLGVEIVKMFPGASVGGAGFVKAILGPSPWTRIMPTGGVSATEDSIKQWFTAGVTCVGLGSDLINKEVITQGDYASITQKCKQVLAWIKQYRTS